MILFIRRFFFESYPRNCVMTYSETILVWNNYYIGRKKKMEPQENDKQDYGIYFLLAVICGIATAWVVTGSITWILVGAVLGLLTAGFFVNVIVKKKRE